MFSGIVQGFFPIRHYERKSNKLLFSVLLNTQLLQDLKVGASVAINGVCLTVIKIDHEEVFFDAIAETLEKTTLGALQQGSLVNVERSVRMGDEIGGHLLSGHISATATIQQIDHHIITLSLAPSWMKYLFPKGYIALDGTSLTLVEVDPKGTFTVHLIPETLRMTCWGHRKKGDKVNIEVDSQTQAIVDTVERLYQIK